METLSHILSSLPRSHLHKDPSRREKDRETEGKDTNAHLHSETEDDVTGGRSIGSSYSDGR